MSAFTPDQRAELRAMIRQEVDFGVAAIGGDITRILGWLDVIREEATLLSHDADGISPPVLSRIAREANNRVNEAYGWKSDPVIPSPDPQSAEGRS